MDFEQLPSHQQRVVGEKADLDKKANALSQFISANKVFCTLDPAEQERLKEQNDLMWKYSEVLGARISAFGARQEVVKAFAFEQGLNGTSASDLAHVHIVGEESGLTD